MKILIVIFVCLILAGCGSKDASSENEQKPIDENLPKVEFPKIDLDKKFNFKPLKKTDLSVQRDTKFTVTGLIEVPEDFDLKKRVAFFYLRITRKHGNGDRVFETEEALVEKLSDSKYRFRAEIKSPKKRGKYTLSLKMDNDAYIHTELTVN